MLWSELSILTKRLSCSRAGWPSTVLKTGSTNISGPTLEATTNAWLVHDLLEPLVNRVVVAHPYHVKLISAATVKTDKRDTLALAKLLAAEVWVPPHHVRELRALIAHRKRLISQRTAAKNRLHSILHRHNLVPPSGRPFADDNRSWWVELALPTSEKLRLRQDWTIIEHLTGLIEQVEVELTHLSVSSDWADQVPFLIQLPGIGLLTAMTILSAIGDISRFPSAKKLVGYAGLGGRIHASGTVHHTGSITKQGRKELRSALVEAAWITIKHHPYWLAQFQRLEHKKGPKKAIVAIARKLLVVIWNVLTAQAADRRAEAALVAKYLMNWASQHRLSNQHLGIRRPVFVRQQLDRLGLGQDLQGFKWGSVYFKLPPSSLVAQSA
jgi:transposase